MHIGLLRKFINQKICEAEQIKIDDGEQAGLYEIMQFINIS